MHRELILSSVLSKIFSLKKFELKCSIQVKIGTKMNITENRCCGLKVILQHLCFLALRLELLYQ